MDIQDPKKFLDVLIDKEASKRAKKQNQELINICFDIVSTIYYNKKWINNTTREEAMNWVATQLKACGYDTVPMGSSWGVLVDK